MIRYRLDDLGWFQFEWLIQALLKDELGISVQSWGDRRDFGRDAYAPSSLRFPDRDILTDGPFIFQIKFVEQANSAGSNVDGRILDSVTKEVSRIQKRVTDGTWAKPSHYLFITNAPLSAHLRVLITDRLSSKVSKTTFHTWSGSDVCDLLDTRPNLRKSFPQLLGLRDLSELLRNVVSAEIIERSQIAIEIARHLFDVFVPTTAYDRTWQVLDKYHFAVLEGPPEMGKTAIAWMIASAQLSNGWEAIVCDDPADFFRTITMDAKQVFVADDAFGRTEYDPSRGVKWEKDLDRILARTDSRHWLIWTARKHILERALKQMDLQGRASKFPSPGAVLVNASYLSPQEKALMLYRHVKAKVYDRKTRDLLKTTFIHSYRILLSDDNFTPERIRRFIQERLPELENNILSGSFTAEEMLSEILAAIRNPTERMRKAFQSLPIEYKWFLISFLEAERRPSPDFVYGVYEHHCQQEGIAPIHGISEELSESFLKNAGTAQQTLEWIHPSYRDLVIDELASDALLRKQFLRSASIEGLKLAVSEAGGAKGGRKFPFLQSEMDQKAFMLRCIDIAETASNSDISGLLESLSLAATNRSDEASASLTEAIKTILNAVRERWNRQKTALSAVLLRTYCEASLLIQPLPPLPDLDSTWQSVTSQLELVIDTGSSHEIYLPDALEELAELVVVLEQNEPRLLRQYEFPTRYEHYVSRAINLCNRLANGDLENISLTEEAALIYTAGKSLKQLVTSIEVPEHLIEQLEDRASIIEGMIDQDRDSEYDPIRSEINEDREVAGIFSDL